MNALATPSGPAAADFGFSHPLDAWYEIEHPGEHPNTRAGVVQVIDNQAVNSIVANFNREADATPNFPGMLIDIEHFKHDDDKETRAFGWLMRLRNRGGILEGQIRWTGTGRQAVDGGDYRFFSTEFLQKDLQVLSNTKPRRVRPLRLDGLTLTNVPNNKGARPITNRIINRQPSTPPIRNTMNTLTEESPAANSAMAKSLAETMAAQTGLPFEAAWNSIRSSRPDLFGLESREVLDMVQNRQANERAQRLAIQNRPSGLSAASIGLTSTLTLTQRYHGAQGYEELPEPVIVNRGPMEPFELTDLVQDFQRENNLPSFCVAWDRAKVAHPEWFFTTV